MVSKTRRVCTLKDVASGENKMFSVVSLPTVRLSLILLCFLTKSIFLLEKSFQAGVVGRGTDIGGANLPKMCHLWSRFDFSSKKRQYVYF
jgi:hypothetical protein